MGFKDISKVELLVHKSIVNDFLGDIQKLELLDIDLGMINKDEEEALLESIQVDRDDIDLYRQNFLNIQKVLKFCQDFEEKKGMFDEVKLEEYSSEQAKEFFRENEIVDVFIEKIEEFNNYSEEIEHLESKIEHYEPVLGFNLDLEYLRNSEHANFHFFSTNKAKYQNMVEEIKQIDLADIIHIDSFQSDEHFIAVFDKEVSKQVMAIIRKFNSEETFITEDKGKIETIVRNIKNKVFDMYIKRDDLFNELESLYSKNSGKIKFLYDTYQSEILKYEEREKFLGTESIEVVTCWIQGDNKPTFERMLEKYPEVSYKYTQYSEEDNPPVVLNNNAIASPYGFLTSMYSLPKVGEIDPTPLFAPFFALFFGICITDAGYGLLMFLSGLFLAKKSKGGMKQLATIILQSGIATFVVGILTGSYFGIELTVFPENIQSIINKFIILKPLEEPMKLFILSLSLGVIQMTFSYAVTFYVNIRNGDFLKGLGEGFSYVLITLGMPMFAAIFFGALTGQVYTLITALMFVIGIILILLFKGRGVEEKGDRIIEKAFGIYDIIGVFGDILSYSRLLALGLATGVIAQVVNILLAMIYGDGLSFAGSGIITSPLKILALIALAAGGHLFNLAINALGGFVHSLRLQYVEFFKQFFEGGGREFKTFKRSTKYTKIN